MKISCLHVRTCEIAVAASVAIAAAVAACGRASCCSRPAEIAVAVSLTPNVCVCVCAAAIVVQKQLSGEGKATHARPQDFTDRIWRASVIIPIVSPSAYERELAERRSRGESKLPQEDSLPIWRHNRHGRNARPLFFEFGYE